MNIEDVRAKLESEKCFSEFDFKLCSIAIKGNIKVIRGFIKFAKGVS